MEQIIAYVFLVIGLVVAVWLQVWIIALIIDAFKGGGGGGHRTPETAQQRVVRTMPARRQIAYVYALVTGG